MDIFWGRQTLGCHGFYYARLLSALHEGMIALLVCLSSYCLSSKNSATEKAPFLHRCADAYPEASVTTQDQFLSKRQRYQPIALPQQFSDEEMVRDWTLSPSDITEVAKYRHNFRLNWLRVLHILLTSCSI